MLVGNKNMWSNIFYWFFGTKVNKYIYSLSKQNGQILAIQTYYWNSESRFSTDPKPGATRHPAPGTRHRHPPVLVPFLFFSDWGIGMCKSKKLGHWLTLNRTTTLGSPYWDWSTKKRFHTQTPLSDCLILISLFFSLFLFFISVYFYILHSVLDWSPAGDFIIITITIIIIIIISSSHPLSRLSIGLNLSSLDCSIRYIKLFLTLGIVLKSHILTWDFLILGFERGRLSFSRSDFICSLYRVSRSDFILFVRFWWNSCICICFSCHQVLKDSCSFFLFFF